MAGETAREELPGKVQLEIRKIIGQIHQVFFNEAPLL
jgi:hypothetical protein